jgi:3-oxoacyl-[acyl-carrier-protein] synthase II
MRGDIVITGLGIISPIGIGCDAFWASLQSARSGVRPIRTFDCSGLPVRVAGEVPDFDPKQYVQPRKSLKIMSRDMQFGVAAARMAFEHAGLKENSVDPDRLGAVFGADVIVSPLEECAQGYSGCLVEGKFSRDLWIEKSKQAYPLWMLKTLPNMVAAHISIALDARGPNNTIHLNDVSSLLALTEAASVIERGWADVMVAGGASSLMDPDYWTHSCVVDQLSPRNGATPAAPRPFDAARDGQVRGEGAAALVLERRQHAQARGAEILGRILGWGAGAEGHLTSNQPSGLGYRNAMTAALRDTALTPAALGHVNAHGLGTVWDDHIEAEAIRAVLGETPAVAFKSYFGNLGAAASVLEIAASLLALKHNLVPFTLNHDRRGADCPLRVVHHEPLVGARPCFMAINQTRLGQAAALIVGAV